MALRCLLGRTVKTCYQLKPKLGFWSSSNHTVKARYPSCRCCRSWDPVFRIDPRILDSIPDDYEYVEDIDPEILKWIPDFTRIAQYGGPLTDPCVLEAACSAVEQFNQQQNAQLEFVRLLKAGIQSHVGTMFHLTLVASCAGVEKKYKAEILRNASKNCILELESFQPVDDDSPET